MVPLPAWSAAMVQVPIPTKESVPPLVMAQTLVVVEVKVTPRPDVEVAVRVGVVLKLCGPGLAKVMVCAALGVMEFDAEEAGPVPAELVAVTLKV